MFSFLGFLVSSFLSLNFLILKSMFSFFLPFSPLSYQENFLSSKDECTAHLQNFIHSQAVGSTAEVVSFVIKLLGVQGGD